MYWARISKTPLKAWSHNVKRKTLKWACKTKQQSHRLAKSQINHSAALRLQLENLVEIFKSSLLEKITGYFPLVS